MSNNRSFALIADHWATYKVIMVIQLWNQWSKINIDKTHFTNQQSIKLSIKPSNNKPAAINHQTKAQCQTKYVRGWQIRGIQNQKGANEFSVSWEWRPRWKRVENGANARLNLLRAFMVGDDWFQCARLVWLFVNAFWSRFFFSLILFY